ncbi:glutamate-rich protein 3-like isoform X2 [Convolutriloba macropyga]|uniref:glutamate-rich protein 3-like isoform X2 n=1 Tax=Convolutriloba macropyga TaxID=536237 RepID=UPI003F521A9D
MSSSEAGPLANYNSLTDKHLCGFFRNARTQRHLRRMGLITKRGEVVSEEMFRISHARREHKKHVRELLAQAIVHKTLDLERTRQIQIRNRLEDMAKRELVERVKSERSMKGDEDVLSLMSPRSKPRKKASSAKSGSRKSKGDDNTYMSDDSAAQDPLERPKSSKSAKSTRSNFEIDANGLPVFKRNDEVVDSQYLSRLTPRALRQFTMSLTNIDYMSGISPYVLPQVEPVPPQTPRQQPTRSSTAGSPRNTRSRGQRRHYFPEIKEERRSNYPRDKVASLHPPHEEVQHPRRLETQVKVTMKYLGVHKEKWGAANQSGGSQAQLEEEPDEILLMQQHCGGNTYPIFRGFLYRNTEFAFYSKRHRGYPFSITLYINGKADSRISTCCEFKHSPKGDKPFVKLGGKLGRFSFGKSESEKNEGMCYRCRAEAKMALDDNKNKTDDEYDEDFQESSAEEEGKLSQFLRHHFLQCGYLPSNKIFD